MFRLHKVRQQYNRNTWDESLNWNRSLGQLMKEVVVVEKDQIGQDFVGMEAMIGLTQVY